MNNLTFEDFIYKYPEKTLKLSNGLFKFRYAQHSTSQATVILLAGGIGIGDSFYRHFEALAQHFSVVTFNYPKDFRTNQQLAQAIALLIRKLNLKNVYLIGQSYGGFISQIIAKHYPKLIKGMVLSNTGTLTSCLDFEGFENLYNMLKKSERYIRYDRYLPLPLLKPILKAGIKKKCKDVSPERQVELAHFADITFKQITNAHLLLMDTLLADLKNEWNLTKEDFASYDNEVLLLLSADDHTFAPSVTSALVQMMPNPTVNTSIPGGHLAPLFAFDTYIDTIVTFINERNP
ncbi:MAG: alpha/beta hydrolase [Cellulosilyticum sp.]|nr:alpha/beta hydrolase [Cellulosilyticum sp.]